ATPLAVSTPTPHPTIAPTKSVANASWWPTELTLLPNATFVGDVTHIKGEANWIIKDVDVDAFADSIFKQATQAGYKIFSVSPKQGEQYFFQILKGGNAYTLTMWNTNDGTMLKGFPVGIIHLKTSVSSKPIEVDLPALSPVPGKGSSGGLLIISGV